jgi:DNA topoisomerase-2
MHLFDPTGNIKKYLSTDEILGDFFQVRLEYYEKRKVFCNIFFFYSKGTETLLLCFRNFLLTLLQESLLHELRKKLEKLKNQIRFINDVVHEKINFRNMTRGHVLQYLLENGYSGMKKESEEGRG